MKKKILVILIVSIFMMVSFVGEGIAYSTNGNPKYDPWGKKAVLNYLLCTADTKLQQDVKALKNEVGLTDNQMAKLKELAIQEHNFTAISSKNSNDANKFNQQIAANSAEIDREVRMILGKKYGKFRKWIINWWQNERDYRIKWLKEKRSQANNRTGILANTDRELVYATQYNGYTDNEVALPDKYVKFANKGWPIPD
ncbi:MAG: hypothetical protein DRI33_00510 [Caldiserica bacterium]|nr:MAG: hypothetical protein DRI33_00510 [Caldisericota bacterium]